MVLEVKTDQRNYPIVIGRGELSRAGELIRTRGRVFIISDTGVPECWKDRLSEQLPDAPVYIFEQGEENKCLRVYGEILKWLAENRASRRDTVVALGGGVTGDMAGFAAATYMRGIGYINIPTTSLSQIDSGIGGKTAIDHAGIKNIAGAFWQPSLVIIDPDVLSTLSPRQMASGLAEAVKSALIGDKELFRIFESGEAMDRLDEVISRSLMVKRAIVEADENEQSLRKLLNLGHTFGHAYESFYGGRYLHGECVAMGMMKIIRNEEIKERLGRVLSGLGLPLSCDADAESIISLIMNDKKAAGDCIDIAQADEIGKAHLETWTMEDIRRTLK